jgi:hypothetical protein
LQTGFSQKLEEEKRWGGNFTYDFIVMRRGGKKLSNFNEIVYVPGIKVFVD